MAAELRNAAVEKRINGRSRVQTAPGSNETLIFHRNTTAYSTRETTPEV